MEATYIIVRSSAKAARFALNTLPSIFFNRENHVSGELEAGGMG